MVLSMKRWMVNLEYLLSTPMAPNVGLHAVKLSKKRVKAASSASSESDVEIKECLCIDYQKRDDVCMYVPGVEIETSSDIFWVPIAHCTRYSWI